MHASGIPWGNWSSERIQTNLLTATSCLSFLLSRYKTCYFWGVSKEPCPLRMILYWFGSPQSNIGHWLLCQGSELMNGNWIQHHHEKYKYKKKIHHIHIYASKIMQKAPKRWMSFFLLLVHGASSNPTYPPEFSSELLPHRQHLWFLNLKLPSYINQKSYIHKDRIMDLEWRSFSHVHNCLIQYF